MNTIVTRLVTASLLLLVVVFAIYQGYRSLNESYRTENAYEYQIARYCNTEGLLVRTEKPIQKNTGGHLRYLLAEGEKFRSDTPIAQAFSSQEAVEAAAQREEVQAEKDLLESIQRSTDTSKTADVETLNKEIALTLRQLTQSAGEKDMNAVQQTHMALVEKIGRQQLATGQHSGFGDRIRELNQELVGGSGGEYLYSSQVGYFSRYVDGYEEEYTPDMLERLDAETLKGMIAKEYPNDFSAFGKSVTDFTWYYATVIPPESAEYFYLGANVDLTFLGGGEQTVPGKVTQLKTEEDGSCLTVIRSGTITADTVSHRTAKVRVSFSSYKGLRISQKALRIQDGEKGVFVRAGYSVRFKRVEIVYTGSDYYLCRIQYGSSDELSLFDEVIVEGTDLYDGKPIDPR